MGDRKHPSSPSKCKAALIVVWDGDGDLASIFGREDIKYAWGLQRQRTGAPG